MIFMIKTVIQGNLARDPELKELENNKKVCILTVASNRICKAKPDILRIEVWNKSAENCHKFLKMGAGIFAAGDLDIDIYERDGLSHVAVKLVNAQVEFTDRVKQQ